MFRLKTISQPHLFALLSVICPVIAAILSWLISYSHSDFWVNVNKDLKEDANRHAAAMMAASEGIQILFFLVAGCVLGLILALISLVMQRTKLGFFGLALNAFPFVLFASMLAWH